MRLLTTHYSYIAILLVSLAGLAIADRRWHLVLFDRPRVGLTTLTALTGFFLLWDVTGIILGIFSTNQQYVIGLGLGTPNLPIEEVLFLVLFGYFTLIIWHLTPPGIRSNV